MFYRLDDFHPHENTGVCTLAKSYSAGDSSVNGVVYYRQHWAAKVENRAWIISCYLLTQYHGAVTKTGNRAPQLRKHKRVIDINITSCRATSS